MAKLTTEEFIAKAKAVHGDRYAYSKVKYVDNKTKVCIICKIHGEFMQPPSMHMRGHGCAKCSTERNTEKLMIWTREKCYEEAQKCNSRSDFKESCPYGYSSARKHGWLDDYTWFAPARKQVPAGYWTYERCYVEAKKYKTRTGFQKGNASAYSKALKEGWIDDYYWLHSRQTKPAGYWDNYDHCYEEAKKYKNRREFQRGCVSGYLHAHRNGWLDDYTWFKVKTKNNFWNINSCYEEARKYETKKEFMRNANGAYQKAKREGWLDGYTWFKPLTGFWTYEACKAEAAKYERRGQFKAGCIGAYTKSRINGWLDEFFPNKK